MPTTPYYRRDLALVHHRGFGFHADACASGILDLLEPVRKRDGVVLEVGCGSGLLTRLLLDAGHRVVATDASPAMVDLAADYASGAEDVLVLALPDDDLPQADAIVSTGHALSYLDDEAQIHRSLLKIGDALRPGGLFALDICDLDWGRARVDAPAMGRVGDDWAIITRFSMPSEDRFVRDMTVFLRDDDGTWRRDDEHHENVLIDTSRIPDLFEGRNVDVVVRNSFGTEKLPTGLHVIVGQKAPR
ncbi:MAG: class I SAM-dependent methyltransferase [Actinomycetota bacterium]